MADGGGVRIRYAALVARIAPWVGPAFVAMAIVLLPWIVYLRLTLPTQQIASHYRTAWVGFDFILFSQLARTGIYAFRKREREQVRLHAAVCATLLTVDAWFDVTTSPKSDLPVSIALAVLIELPLAFVCWQLARHYRGSRAPRGSATPDA
ncbi:MAG TPA: hypothetical protein VFN97_16345 [Actinospica sp.]|nr:hypothetical protein [Actinospica sp.]